MTLQTKAIKLLREALEALERPKEDVPLIFRVIIDDDTCSIEGSIDRPRTILPGQALVVHLAKNMRLTINYQEAGQNDKGTVRYVQGVQGAPDQV